MTPKQPPLHGAALDELQAQIIEKLTEGIAHLSEQLAMARRKPDPEQQLSEAITAEASAYRAHIRALLGDIAALVGKPAPELSAALSSAIDALFEARRNSAHEWMANARGVVVPEQLALLRAQDDIAALVKLHINELAVAGLNSIERGGA